jgi:enoyl-CoA hydratase/carnithine racemase
MTGSIRLERQGQVGVVTIENPAKLNALTVAMWAELAATFGALKAEGSPRCLVLRGSPGKAFAAGADISEFPRERANGAQIATYHETYVGPALEAILECAIPTIAAIQGVCVGGGLEIAAACDFRIASEESLFGIPTIHMGFPLAFGEAELIFKAFGRSVAADLLLEGRVFDANAALHAGMIRKVVDARDLMAEAAAITHRVCAGSASAIRNNKAQLLRLFRDGTPVSEAERLRSYQLADSEDYRRGVEAFFRKQPPTFCGA